MRLPEEVIRLIAPNPDPYTLSGTNTWTIVDPETSTAVLVDPGPLIPSHVEAMVALLSAQSLTLEAILLTHGHDDHAGAVDVLHERTGAPVRAANAMWCRAAAPLRDGESIGRGVGALLCVMTPGHTFDSVCFMARSMGAILTGDTVLGGSSTMIDHPDGSLASYFESMNRLTVLAAAEDVNWLLPGHGEPSTSAHHVLVDEVRHRRLRVEQVEGLLTRDPSLGDEDIVELLYPGLDPILREGARQNVTSARELLTTAVNGPSSTVHPQGGI